MTTQLDTIAIEDQSFAPFFNRQPISIERGEGVWVWDERERRYLDLTAGWGVTCLGHASPVITAALDEQSRKIIQNPNSGLTYSPARARLLELLRRLLPQNLTRIFFSNSGAEANDAALKLARKATGRLTVLATERSFHGRTISTASATGQASHRDKYKPLMPHHEFVPYGDLAALERRLTQGGGGEVAAFIVEPVQGEGGVNIPDPGYLPEASALCARHGTLLIADEVQTGFLRTGKMFAIEHSGARVDMITLAKGIAGGFPLGAFAMTEAVSQRLAKGDHGGTYCGNPLACAVAHAVISRLAQGDIERNVNAVGALALARLRAWETRFPGLVSGARGLGLLLAFDLPGAADGDAYKRLALERGLIVNVTQGRTARLCPALTITAAEMAQGLDGIEQVLAELNTAPSK